MYCNQIKKFSGCALENMITSYFCSQKSNEQRPSKRGKNQNFVAKQEDHGRPETWMMYFRPEKKGVNFRWKPFHVSLCPRLLDLDGAIEDPAAS